MLRRYDRRWLRGDVVAGLAVAAYLVPQCMAYADLAGLAPVAGLWSVIAPMVVYAIVGSSRLLSVGPESTTAILVPAAVAPLAGGDSARYAALSAALAVLVGVVCLAGRLARTGFLANLLSKPLLVGYLAGVGVIMIAGQLGRVAAVPVSGGDPVTRVRSLAGQVDGVHLPTVALAAGVLAVLLVLARWAPAVPGALVALALATAVTVLAGLDERGIAVVGTVPNGLPRPSLPDVALADLSQLLAPAVGIAVVGYTDAVLVARAFATRREEAVDANQELLGLGLANVGAGLAQGFPVSSSGSRTALADSLGARTQLYSLVTVAAVVLVLLVGTPLLARFPVPALGALVIYAALRLIDVRELRRLASFRKAELVLALVTAVGVAAVGVLPGIVVALALSVVQLFAHLMHPHDAVLGRVPGLAGLHDVDDHPDAARLPGIVLYRYDAPLIWANAEDFKQRALRAVDEEPQPVDWFVLNAEANVEVDITGLDAIEDLRSAIVARGLGFGMARVKQDLLTQLERCGLAQRIGRDHIWPTLPTALEAIDQLRDR